MSVPWLHTDQPSIMCLSSSDLSVTSVGLAWELLSSQLLCIRSYVVELCRTNLCGLILLLNLFFKAQMTCHKTVGLSSPFVKSNKTFHTWNRIYVRRVRNWCHSLRPLFSCPVMAWVLTFVRISKDWLSRKCSVSRVSCPQNLPYMCVSEHWPCVSSCINTYCCT